MPTDDLGLLPNIAPNVRMSLVSISVIASSEAIRAPR
jgi:hypothetical protein